MEIESIYCETLRTNHPDWNVVEGDIMTYTKEQILEQANLQDDEVDLMIGGSPCQSFSTAGKRQAFADPRGQAMLKFAELVRDIRPKAFMIENVRGLLSAALKHRPLSERERMLRLIPMRNSQVVHSHIYCNNLKGIVFKNLPF